MKKFISIAVAFLIWAGIFFGQIAFGVTWPVVMLTMFFVALPLSGWVARKLTGVDPYRLLIP